MNSNTQIQQQNSRARTVVFFRAAVAAVAVAVILSAPVLAAQVSAPTGATLPRGLPILVQWTPSFWTSPTVSIWFQRVLPLPITVTALGTLVENIPNNGSTYVNLPQSFGCDPTHVYQIGVWAKINSTTWMTYRSADFKLSCEGGAIKVIKTVINDSGGPVPNGTFSVDVACGPNGPNTTLALSNANNFSDSVMYIPLGRQCTITEQAPKAPPGCRWTTTYPKGAGVVIENASYLREVRNRLSCRGVGPGGLTGPVEVDGPQIAFPLDNAVACCTPNWNSVPASSYNDPQVIAACSAPTQAQCTSNAMVNCLWNAADPSCSGAGDATGTLTILKKVVNDSTTIPPPNTPFQVQATCSPGGPDVPVTLTAANSFTQIVSNIPANRSCTIVEQAPVVSRDLAKRGCRWETSYPDGQNAAMPSPATALSLTVVNRWTCKEKETAASCCTPDWNSVPASSYNDPVIIAACSAPTQTQCAPTAAVNCVWNASDPRCSGPSGRLRVNKTVINTLGVASPATFSITATCTSPAGVPLPDFALTLTEGPWVNIPDLIPAGNTCHAIEAAQTSIANVRACKGGSASWVTTYLPASVTIAAGATAGLEVINKLTCDPISGDATGTITVTKNIRNRTSKPTPVTPFQVKLDCTPGGPSQLVSLTSPNNLSQTINVPLGSLCTITEIAPEAPRSCRWETSYPRGQEGKVGARFVVKNELLCDEKETGTITVTKRIRNRTSTPTPDAPFQVQVDCTPGGPSQLVSLTSPDNLQQTISVPLGSTCKIAEIAPVAPPSCRWETSYPNDQEGEVGSKFVVMNELLCEEPGTGTDTGTQGGTACCTPDWSTVPTSSYNDPMIIAFCTATTPALCLAPAMVRCVWNTSNPRCANAGDASGCSKAGAVCTSPSQCCSPLTCNAAGFCQ